MQKAIIIKSLIQTTEYQREKYYVVFVIPRLGLVV
jgi:hypothetical protein